MWIRYFSLALILLSVAYAAEPVDFSPPSTQATSKETTQEQTPVRRLGGYGGNGSYYGGYGNYYGGYHGGCGYGGYGNGHSHGGYGYGGHGYGHGHGYQQHRYGRHSYGGGHNHGSHTGEQCFRITYTSDGVRGCQRTRGGCTYYDDGLTACP